MTEILIHLPQTDAMGLSENWLFKHCGERHWDSLCAALGIGGVESERMQDKNGKRLYPTFVAIRARYSQPLAAVRMDELFNTKISLAHFGRSFFQSLSTFENDRASFALEMLTTFVRRDQEGHNGLRQSLPTLHPNRHATALTTPPPLLKRSQSLRRGEMTSYDFLGHQFPLQGPGLEITAEYEPSPYIDFNGAGLLYFAAYPTIADTLERQLINRHGLTKRTPDWALLTSTVGRDIYYHRNLNLGEKLIARLKRFDRVGDHFMIHTELAAMKDGASLADIMTAKRVVGDQHD